MLRFQRVHLMQFVQKRFVSAHQLIFEAAQKEYGVCSTYSFNVNIKIRYKVSIITLVRYRLEFNLGLLSAYKLMCSMEMLYEKKLEQFEIMENQLKVS